MWTLLLEKSVIVEVVIAVASMMSVMHANVFTLRVPILAPQLKAELTVTALHRAPYTQVRSRLQIFQQQPNQQQQTLQQLQQQLLLHAGVCFHPVTWVMAFVIGRLTLAMLYF
jgi:hypothetical protein